MYQYSSVPNKEVKFIWCEKDIMRSEKCLRYLRIHVLRGWRHVKNMLLRRQNHSEEKNLDCHNNTENETVVWLFFLQGLKSNWRTCTIRPWLLLVIFRSWTRSPKSPMESRLVPLSHCLWLRRPSKTRSIKIKVHWFQSDETQKTLHCSVVQIFKKFKANCDWSKCTFYRLSNQNVPGCGRDATVVCRPSNQKRGGMYHTKTQASEFLSTNSLRYNLWYLPPLYNDDSYKERVDIITFILKNLLIKIWRLVRRHLYTYLYNTCI